MFKSPSDAIAVGIGMVFQHFMLADNLTALENVVLGAEKLHGIGDDARSEFSAISERYGFNLRPDVLVERLGVADRQRLEILKVLYRGAQVIILDEPTAVLVPQEVDALFENLRDLRKHGHSVLFISHKLDEVLAIADDITVMRRGTTVGEAKPDTTTKRQLAELMVGSELPSPEATESTVTDVVQLSLQDVTLTDESGRNLLTDISFDIHRGEVLGIAGVEGNGQAELVETVMGMRDASAGTILLGDRDVTAWDTRRLREAGIAYIPEDRHRHGLLLDSPLWENRILGHQTQAPSASGPWIDRGGARADTDRIVREYDVRTPSIDTLARALSGGQPAEAHRRPRDERRPGRPDRLPPHARRRRRCTGRDLGTHQEGPARRAGGPADLRRPRRADRPLRPDRGHPPRSSGRELRPGEGHPAGSRLGHDRRR